MGHLHIIKRTEKVRDLRERLKKERFLYLSAFFYCGKTQLLEQLAQSLEEPVLWFRAGREGFGEGSVEGSNRHAEWEAFKRQAADQPGAVLLIDDLQKLQEVSGVDDLESFLYSLPRRQRVVMAGRAQMPSSLQRMIMTGEVTILNMDYVLLSKEESEQIFLEYGLELSPSDIARVHRETWGSPFMLQAVARQKIREPERPLSALRQVILTQIRMLVAYEFKRTFSEEVLDLLCRLSLFERFTGEMARAVTGCMEASELMRRISMDSYALLDYGKGTYSFLKIPREALVEELKNRCSQEDIDGLYRKAALYYEAEGQIPGALSCYILLKDREKIRELLIRETSIRPGSGYLPVLRKAYAQLSEETILQSPELMRGMCMIESMRGRPEESERWFRELRRFAAEIPNPRNLPENTETARTAELPNSQNFPGKTETVRTVELPNSRNSPEETKPAHTAELPIPRDHSREDLRRRAEEALAYLEIALPHRGTKHLLTILKKTAEMRRTQPQPGIFQAGFSVAGNGVSILNGGKDFCHWVPNGWNIYRIAGRTIEDALGRNGIGLADIAIGECELESSLTGDYQLALEKVTTGLSRIPDDLELRSAGVGLLSRILMAEGEITESIWQIDNLLENLPKDVPLRLRKNLQIYRLTLLMMKGETKEALDWQEMNRPEEPLEVVVLDRYRLILMLRLYIITGRWAKAGLLITVLCHYAEQYDRKYIRIQLHLLQAVVDRRTGRDSWRTELASALTMAKQYRLLRVIADEGAAVLDMLNEMELPDEPWENAVRSLTRRHASQYPTYMRQTGSRPVFTEREKEVYILLSAGYKNAKIASTLGLSERTVKYYASRVYQKLGVRTRAEAISRAVELGDANQ